MDEAKREELVRKLRKVFEETLPEGASVSVAIRLRGSVRDVLVEGRVGGAFDAR